MATIRLDIDPAIDNRVLLAVARYFGWPKGQVGAFEGKTRKEYVTAKLAEWMTSLARTNEINDTVEDADTNARVAATVAANELVVTAS